MPTFASDNVRPPRVYVYPQPQLSRFFRSLPTPAQAREWAFGPSLGADFSATDTWALAAILMYRLHWQRPSLLTTNDANEADLFVVPLVPRRPLYGTATTHATSFHQEVAGICDHLLRDDLRKNYSHLNEHTAPRHVVAAVHFTPILGFCALSGHYHDRPPSHRLLRGMRWLHHEEFTPSPAGPHAHFSRLNFLPSTPGGALSVNVPYPSAVHSRAAIRRDANPDRPRQHLLSFTGSLNGSPRNRAVRRAIAAQCARAGAPTCRALTFAPGADLAGDGIVRAYQLKRMSTFCAEPGGHTNLRKGVADAISCGCIPILFLAPSSELAKLWPHHLFGWRNASYINIAPDRLLLAAGIGGRSSGAVRRGDGAVSGGDGGGVSSDLDLIAHLQAIPRATVAAMQRALADHGHRLAYLADDTYEGDDALDVMLKGMAFGLPG